MEKPTRYMFVCYAAAQRSPTAVDVSLNLAAKRGMNLEACCYGTNKIPNENGEFERCRRKFKKQDRVFVMTSDIAETVVGKIGVPEDKITCLDIEDNYNRGGLNLREKLRTKIYPWITEGNNYPDKKYLVLSLIDCPSAVLGVDILREKGKKEKKKKLIDYIAIDWDYLLKECSGALADEDFYDRIIIFEDTILDKTVIKESLTETLKALAKNPDKIGTIEAIDYFRNRGKIRGKISAEIDRLI